MLAALAGGLALAAAFLLDGWVGAVAWGLAFLLGVVVWIFGTEGAGPAP